MERKEWTRVAEMVAPDTVAATQAKTLGRLASILGDDAYTALAMKGRFVTSSKKLVTLSSAPQAPDVEAALEPVIQMEKVINDFVALVPSSVVDQVRTLRRAGYDGVVLGRALATFGGPELLAQLGKEAPMGSPADAFAVKVEVAEPPPSVESEYAP